MIKKVFSNINFEELLLAISILSLTFLYDIKFYYFDFRYIFILPFIYFLYKKLNNKFLYENKKIIIIFFIFLATIIIQSLIYTNEIYRNLISYFSTILIFFTILFGKNKISQSIKLAINTFLILLILLFLIYFLFDPLKSEIQKIYMLITEACRGLRLNGAKFIFSESSHVQIVFYPAFCYWMVSSKSNNIKYTAIFLLLFSIYLINITTSALLFGIIIPIYILILKFIFKNQIRSRVILSNILILILASSLLVFQKNDAQISRCKAKLVDLGATKSTLNPFSEKVKIVELEELKKELKINNIKLSTEVDENKTANIIKKIEDLEKKILKIEEIQNSYFEQSYKKEKKGVINITSFTYLTNLKLTLNSLKSQPFGYGLNNYEVAYKEYIEKIYIKKYYISATGLNRNDGGSTLLKIFVEFGFIGILILFPVLMSAFSNKISIENKIFLCTLILTQLIRGVGYFNGGFMFFLIIIYLAYFNKIKI
tara:strand:+ start:127 stop:1578 length:1452 start_codon:yes stop_codon:yes gene_type:complete